MNFRKVKLDLQTWLTENQLDQSGMQILEGKNLSQDIHMLSSWVKDWDSKTTLVCYSNDLDEDVLTTGITTFKDIPIKYNRDFNECRLVVIGNLKGTV
jgi:hypothetical protein